MNYESIFQFTFVCQVINAVFQVKLNSSIITLDNLTIWLNKLNSSKWWKWNTSLLNAVPFNHFFNKKDLSIMPYLQNWIHYRFHWAFFHKYNWESSPSFLSPKTSYPPYYNLEETFHQIYCSSIFSPSSFALYNSSDRVITWKVYQRTSKWWFLWGFVVLWHCSRI